MENQHKLIKGYRDLSQEEINAMNELKESQAQILNLLENISKAFEPDGRWLAIGKTHIEQGFMAAIRAVAKPE